MRGEPILKHTLRVRLATLSFIALGTLASLDGISAQNPTKPEKSNPGAEKVIFDTDFAIPPQDDSLALMLALKSPEITILGVTTVAGNDTMQRATSDSLKVLELGGRSDIPVYRGANRPLLHEKSEWATTKHGKWWSDEMPPEPPGGFATTQAESENAVSYMVRTVNANPGEITIIALGPLTNIAMAIRLEPGWAQKVKKLVVMGGAIASLADGGGNMTPNAEFNIWVDPEAAQIVFRSGIPITLTPLNVTRKTHFSKKFYDRIVAVDTPFTRLIKERMDHLYLTNPDRGGEMYDQLTVGALVDPTLVKTVELYVDVDTQGGPNYGVTVGGKEPWEGGEKAHKMKIQYDVDFDRFIEMYVKRLTIK